MENERERQSSDEEDVGEPVTLEGFSSHQALSVGFLPGGAGGEDGEDGDDALGLGAAAAGPSRRHRTPLHEQNRRRINAMLAMAELHLEMGQYTDAQLVARKSVEAFRDSQQEMAAAQQEEGSPSQVLYGEANALRTLVRAHFLEAQEARIPPDDADSLVQVELARFRSLRDRRGEAMMLLVRSEINSDKRAELPERCEHCSSSCQVDDINCPVCGIKRPKAIKYESLKIQRSFDWAFEAFKMFEAEDDKRFQAIALLEIGYCSFRKSDANTVAWAATKALKLFATAADKRGDVHATNLLAHAYVLIGEFDLALEKANQALEIAEYLDRQLLVRLQLDTIIWIHTVKNSTDESRSKENGGIQDLQGRWQLRSGEEIAAINGKLMVWADSSSVSPIAYSPDGKFSCELDGETCVGQLDKNGEIIWDDGDHWIRVLDMSGLPSPQAARRASRSTSRPLGTEDGSADTESSNTESFNTDENPTLTLKSSLKLRRATVFKDGLRRLCRILISVGAGVDSVSLTPLLDTPIAALGLTSTQLYIARHLMSQHFEEQLPATIFLDLPTIGALAAFLVGADVDPGEGRQVEEPGAFFGQQREAQQDHAMHAQQEQRHTKQVRKFRARRALAMGDRMVQLGVRVK